MWGDSLVHLEYGSQWFKYLATDNLYPGWHNRLGYQLLQTLCRSPLYVHCMYKLQNRTCLWNIRATNNFMEFIVQNSAILPSQESFYTPSPHLSCHFDSLQHTCDGIPLAPFLASHFFFLAGGLSFTAGTQFGTIYCFILLCFYYQLPPPHLPMRKYATSIMEPIVRIAHLLGYVIQKDWCSTIILCKMFISFQSRQVDFRCSWCGATKRCSAFDFNTLIPVSGVECPQLRYNVATCACKTQTA